MENAGLEQLREFLKTEAFSALDHSCQRRLIQRVRMLSATEARGSGPTLPVAPQGGGSGPIKPQ